MVHRSPQGSEGPPRTAPGGVNYEERIPGSYPDGRPSSRPAPNAHHPPNPPPRPGSASVPPGENSGQRRGGSIPPKRGISTERGTQSEANTVTIDEWRRLCAELEREVKEERQKARQAQLTMQSTSDDADHWHEQYREEKKSHEKARAALQKSTEDARYWQVQLQLATEDDNAGAVNTRQVRSQLEDSEIITQTQRLRLQVRDFAVLHSECNEDHLRVSPEGQAALAKYLHADRNTLGSYVRSGATRPAILKAFIWAFLRSEIFDRYLWAPPSVDEAARSLRLYLGTCKPELTGKPRPFQLTVYTEALDAKHTASVAPEAQRRFHIWRAETSGLILDAKNLKDKRKAEHSHRSAIAKTAQSLAGHLKYITPAKSDKFITSLEKLIDSAFSLDQIFSQQVARWSWYFLPSSPCNFDPDMMDMVDCTMQPGPERLVYLTLAPALVKRGRSSGDEFDLAPEVRLQMEVDGHIPGAHPSQNAQNTNTTHSSYAAPPAHVPASHTQTPQTSKLSRVSKGLQTEGASMFKTIKDNWQGKNR